MMNIRKANDLFGIPMAFRETPLSIEDIDKFYIENWKARGGFNFRKNIKRALYNETGFNKKILFIGYKGCGKSTELNYLQKEIGDDFLILNFSVLDELDPIHLNYIELFIVMMEKLFKVAEQEKIIISKHYLKSITSWIKTKEIEEIREKYNIGIEGEVGAEGNYGIPFLQKFFYKFKLSAKSSRSLKETLKTNVEPKLSDLINHCNDLIREIKSKLQKINKKDIVIIIEDLDKLPFDRGEELFFNYTPTITRIEGNVIFTFPIALYHHTRFNTISNYFTHRYELPMIKIKNKNGGDNEEGIQTMKKIIAERMDLSLFKEESLYLKFIEYSGGVIRDVFRMIQDAASTALDYDKEKIDNDDFNRALNFLKNDYENNVSDNVVDGKHFSAKQYYHALVRLAKSTTKKVENTEEELHLRQNLSILGYNGENWYDVHPIIKIILKEKGKL